MNAGNGAYMVHSNDAVHHGAPTGARTAEERSAILFFWGELLLVAAMSIAGNIVHAWTNAPAGKEEIAAFVASFPPIALLVATHGVGLLVKAKNKAKAAYWAVVALTAAIAAIAFRLSFDALRELSEQVGISEDLAFLMPLIIDGAIGQATIALLVLARTGDAPAVRTEPKATHHSAPVRTVAVRETRTETRTTDTELTAREEFGELGPGPRTIDTDTAHHTDVERTTGSNPPAPAPVERTDRWEVVAARLCEGDSAGRRDPSKVAQILRLRYEQDWSHARIAEHVSMSSSTVTRTLAAAAEYAKE